GGHKPNPARPGAPRRGRRNPRTPPRTAPRRSGRVRVAESSRHSNRGRVVAGAGCRRARGHSTRKGTVEVFGRWSEPQRTPASAWDHRTPAIPLRSLVALRRLSMTDASQSTKEKRPTEVFLDGTLVR